MAAPPNPGNPPQSSPGSLLKWMASAAWSDSSGVLTPPALQWVARIVNQVINGVLGIEVNGTTVSAGVLNFEPGISATLSGTTLDISAIQVELAGSVKAVDFVNFSTGMTGVVAAGTLTLTVPGGVTFEIDGTVEPATVVNFGTGTVPSFASSTITVAGLGLELAGVAQGGVVDLNFGTNLGGVLAAGTLTINGSPGLTLEIAGSVQVASVLNFGTNTVASLASGTLSVAGIGLEIAGAPQAGPTQLNFGTNTVPSFAGGTVSIAGLGLQLATVAQAGVTQLNFGSGTSGVLAAGTLTIAASGQGLFRQVLSATPTLANFPSPTSLGVGVTTTNNPTGLTVAGTGTGSGIYIAAPATPYSFTLLPVSAPEMSGSPRAMLGFTDGTKLQIIRTDTTGVVFVQHFSSIGVFVAGDAGPTQALYHEPNIFLRVRDDGTNVFFQYSLDGSNFTTLYTVAKTAGYLGGAGYTNVIVGQTNQVGYVTVMSWVQGT